MVRVKRILLGSIAASLFLLLTGCPSPFFDAIRNTIAQFPFTASSYTFSRQWGSTSPEYSFGAAVVKVDTAGFVYVADSTFRIRKFSAAGALQTTYDIASTSGLNGKVYDMAFDLSGNMYVATDGTNRILKYDVNGNLVLQWGTSATFSTSQLSLAASGGNVYVLDGGNLKVYKFDALGNAGAPAFWDGTGAAGGGTAFMSPSGIAVDASGTYIYVAKTAAGTIQYYAASSGNYVGNLSIPAAVAPLSSPNGIAIDASSNFYISDSGNNRIVKISGSTGTAWGGPLAGTGNGQFTSLSSVAVDSSGNVYTADAPKSTMVAGGTGRIQKFDTSGTFVSSWMGGGLSGDGQFSEPGGVAFDSAGNIYVSDAGNKRIEKFDPTGAYLAQWGASYGPWYGSIAVDSAGNVYAPDMANQVVQILDSSLVHQKNIGSGVLNGPSSVALYAAGNIYVADMWLGKIVVFDANGYTTHVPATFGGTPGTADGHLAFPVGVAVDSTGNVYVADIPVSAPRTHVIQKFDVNGNFVTAWGTSGSGDGQIIFPLGIAVDKYDNVYVSDFANRRIQKFDSSGNFLAKWGTVGVGNGTFGWPFNIAVDSTGNVLVSDVTNNLVQLFAPTP